MTQRSKMSFGMFWNVPGQTEQFLQQLQTNKRMVFKEWSLKMSKQ